MSDAQQVQADVAESVLPDNGQFRAEVKRPRKHTARLYVGVVVGVIALAGTIVLISKSWWRGQQAQVAAKKLEKAEEAKAEARRNAKPFARAASSATSPSAELAATDARPVDPRPADAKDGATASSLPAGFGASAPAPSAAAIPLRTRSDAPAAAPVAATGRAPAAAASAPRVPAMLSTLDDAPAGSAGARQDKSPESGSAEQRLAAYKTRMDALQAQAKAQAQSGGQAAGQAGSDAAAASPGSEPSGSAAPAVAGGRRTRSVQEYAQLTTMRNPTTATPQAMAANLGDRSLLLARGAVIPCVLLTQVHSNVPGAATCQVSEDIWSDDGRVLLVGRGSTIAGSYQGTVRNGDSRMAIVWSRIKSADGFVIDVESPGGDGVGTMGLGGHVDNHWPERIGAALLLSLIDDAVSIEVASHSGGNATRTPTSTANTTKSMSEQVLSTTINIPPTITKARGARLAVLVQRDLWFDGVYSVAKR